MVTFLTHHFLKRFLMCELCQINKAVLLLCKWCYFLNKNIVFSTIMGAKFVISIYTVSYIFILPVTSHYLSNSHFCWQLHSHTSYFSDRKIQVWINRIVHNFVCHLGINTFSCYLLLVNYCLFFDMLQILNSSVKNLHVL